MEQLGLGLGSSTVWLRATKSFHIVDLDVVIDPVPDTATKKFLGTEDGKLRKPVIEDIVLIATPRNTYTHNTTSVFHEFYHLALSF